jgi:hypothetical protein
VWRFAFQASIVLRPVFYPCFLLFLRLFHLFLRLAAFLLVAQSLAL